MNARERELMDLIEPVVRGLDYELVGLEYLSQGRRSLLRIYIDKEAGVTLDDCERVSHQVSGVLEVEDPISSQYVLEVSSPGLDRPLFRAEHYLRYTGSTVRLRLAEPLAGQRKITGVLQGLHEDDVVVVTAEGQRFQVPLALIDSARLVPQW